MSEYIENEVVEINCKPVDGMCLGGGYYPDDAKPIPVNEVDK